MKRVLIRSLAIGLLCLPFGDAHSGSFNFEDSYDGMLKKLTSSPIKTRKFSLDEDKPSIKTRKMIIVEQRDNQSVTETVEVPLEPEGQVVNLKVQFRVNSYALDRKTFPLLDDLGHVLAHPKLVFKSVHIKGHTDSDGDDARNLKLSMNRALAVKEYLIANAGLDAKRLRVVGYGEAWPLVSNNSRTNKATNRRVEIEVTD